MKKSNRESLMYLCIYLCCVPGIACADVTDVLNNFFGYLTGDLGKSVSALAIVSVGYGCYGLGKIPKHYLISVVVGIGIIFGAKSLLNMVSG